MIKNKYEVINSNFFQRDSTVVISDHYTQAEARKVATVEKKAYVAAHPTVGFWGTAAEGYEFSNGHRIKVRRK